VFCSFERKGETVNRSIKEKGKIMKKFKYVSIATGLALGVVASVVYAMIASEATGKGAFLDGDGNTVNINFKAGVDDTGTFFGEVPADHETSRPGRVLAWYRPVL
jgi:hypothetical protein